MPMMVNLSGITVCVNADAVAENQQRGLRLATDGDMNFTESCAPTFSIPNIDGIARKSLGTRPVVVCGMGPSRNWRMPGAYHIACNPRGDMRDDVEAVLTLEPTYWTALAPAWVKGKQRFSPLGWDADATKFTMPLQIYKSGPAHMQTIVNGAIRNAQFSGIAAMLVASYLTDGPIILTGIELCGGDAQGVPYSRQENGWRTAAPLVRSASVQDEMVSPLNAWYPAHLTQVGNRNDKHWLAVGGGPSARTRLREAWCGQRIITSNAGLRIVANPDAYWVSDPEAIKTYSDEYRAAKRHGVCVFSRKELADVSASIFDYPKGDEAFHGRSSGILSLRVALALGARHVSLVGFDGYAEPSKQGMNDAMRLAFARILTDFPSVTFSWFGASAICPTNDRVWKK